jgi:hypothetical protein
MKIFFEANELFALGFTLDIIDETYDTPMTITPPSGVADQRTYTFSQTRKSLAYTYNDNDPAQADKIMFMSLRHLGFHNMLHDFLNKCGIEPRNHRI